MSYPVDDSLYGVRGLSGSVLEWLDTWIDDAKKQQRRLSGGSWAIADGETLKLWSGTAVRPTEANAQTGFRLLLEIGTDER